MSKSNITFVTCYFNIYDEEQDFSRTFEKRLEHFLKLASIGINICIYTTNEYKIFFEEIQKKYNNVKLGDLYVKTQLKFSPFYFPETKLCELPKIRNEKKDTDYYMYLMNSKIDFVNETIKKNPFSTDFFCWFDFSLPYIFINIDETLNIIKNISQTNFVRKCIAMPGCWNFKIKDINYIKNNVCWRFCGGFFMGDKESLNNFYNLSYNNFSEFLDTTKTILWEVNYWAWLETYKGFDPIWYLADHNDSIVNVPLHFFCN